MREMRCHLQGDPVWDKVQHPRGSSHGTVVCSTHWAELRESQTHVWLFKEGEAAFRTERRELPQL